MAQHDLKPLIAAAAESIAGHADHLTALDSAIGDGDHGTNINRGFNALAAELDDIAAKPLPEALKASGMKLVMTVGGASGPLLGTFLMGLGKEIGENPDREILNRAFRSAVDAVAARGKSELGQKTLLDVLYPLADALERGKEISELPQIAQQAAEATIPVEAKKGRASFLGPRSVGHMDPGSQTIALLTSVAADWSKGSKS